MARHLKSNDSRRPAFFVSGRHASVTIRQTRLIRLGRAANDNRAPNRHRKHWLTMITATVAVITLLWLI